MQKCFSPFILRGQCTIYHAKHITHKLTERLITKTKNLNTFWANPPQNINLTCFFQIYVIDSADKKRFEETGLVSIAVTVCKTIRFDKTNECNSISVYAVP